MTREKITVIVVRCCVCGKERVNDEWIEPPEPDDDETERVAVSHSYCPECLESVRRELDALMAS